MKALIEETGRVVAINATSAWVETIRTSARDACSAQKGCGHGLVNKASPGKTFRLEISLGNHSVNIGDEVVVGIPEDSLIKASFICYVLPLMLLMSGAVIGKLWLGEMASALFGLVGLVVGFFLVRKLGNSTEIETTPVLLSVRSLAAVSSC